MSEAINTEEIFYNCTCTYRHEVTDSRRRKVPAHHSSLCNPSPYYFSLLVLPFQFRRIVYNLCFWHFKSWRWRNWTMQKCARYCLSLFPFTCGCGQYRTSAEANKTLRWSYRMLIKWCLGHYNPSCHMAVRGLNFARWHWDQTCM